MTKTDLAPKIYAVEQRTIPTEALTNWQHAAWTGVSAAPIDHFLPSSSANRPQVQARLAHDDQALYLQYRVIGEKNVTARHTALGSMVCEDSCVEFFFQPDPRQSGYLNFEFSCRGVLLCYFIEDATRTNDGFARFRVIEPADLAHVLTYPSLSSDDIKNQTAATQDWTLGVRIGLDWIAQQTESAVIQSGWKARGNFYKCAELSGLPHYACWNPVSGPPNFHQPQYFGELHFK